MINKVEHIISTESQDLKNKISQMIGIYNCFVDIQDAFDNDKTAKYWLKQAENEVIESGNAGLGTIYAVAIHLMAERVRDCEELEESQTEIEINKLRSKISELERQNRIFCRQIDAIKKLFSDGGEV